jgi:hypothetical protein
VIRTAIGFRQSDVTDDTISCVCIAVIARAFREHARLV